MYEVKVRDIPARSLLCLLRHAARQDVWDLGQDPVTAALAQRGRPVRDRAGAGAEAAPRDDTDGQRRKVRAAGDPATDGYFDASVDSVTA